MKFQKPTRPPGKLFGLPPHKPHQDKSFEERIAAKFMARAWSAMTDDERFEFEERMAICMFDGGLSEVDAIWVALNDYVTRTGKSALCPKRTRWVI